MTPEEKELAIKKARLEELEGRLIERELELETLRGGLLQFERNYQAATIERYAQLDELRFRIADLQAQRAPDDKAALAAAQVSKAAAARTAAMARSLKPKPSSEPRPRSKSSAPRPAPAAPQFSPTELLKKLYRDVAKAIHPDLADNDAERADRHKFMIRANEAYEASDEKALSAILEEWRHAPESVKGEGAAAELIRAIRKIARCEDRLEVITIEVDKMQTAGIFGIKMLADEADKLERDFLAEMTGRIDADIAAAKEFLEHLQRSADK